MHYVVELPRRVEPEKVEKADGKSAAAVAVLYLRKTVAGIARIIIFIS